MSITGCCGRLGTKRGGGGRRRRGGADKLFAATHLKLLIYGGEILFGEGKGRGGEGKKKEEEEGGGTLHLPIPAWPRNTKIGEKKEEEGGEKKRGGGGGGR